MGKNVDVTSQKVELKLLLFLITTLALASRTTESTYMGVQASILKTHLIRSMMDLSRDSQPHPPDSLMMITFATNYSLPVL